MAKKEFITLEQALVELRLKEADLKRLVSEGEIRAYRDADKMKFKGEDIEDLINNPHRLRAYGLGDGYETLTDDLLFDEDIECLDLDDDRPYTTPINIIESDPLITSETRQVSMTTLLPVTIPLWILVFSIWVLTFMQGCTE